MILRCFFTQFLDVVLGSIGSQKRVIDQTGPIACGCRLAQHKSDTRRAGIDDAMHALRTAIETVSCAPAHRSLIHNFAVQTRIDYVGNLLDQLFEIPVV